MGHYDDCYEDTETSLRKEEAENLQRWIKEGIENMDVYDLRMVHKVVKNADDYRAFFRVMKNASSDL